MISKGVCIVHSLPTDISGRIRTTWVDFTKSIERPIRSRFPLPIPTPSTSVLGQNKGFTIKT